MLDLVAEYWSEGLSVVAILVAIYTRYYQVQHYKAESADLNVVSTSDGTYEAHAYAPGDGGFQTVDPEEYDDPFNTKYSFSAVVENDGREPTTISDYTLIVPDTGEELELNNERTKAGWKQSFTKLDANDRKSISFLATGEEREMYGDDTEVILRLDSTAERVEEPLTLEFVEPNRQDGEERPDSVFGE